MPKTISREEIAYVGPRKANVHLDIRAHSSMNQTREAKERDDLVDLVRQAQRTGIRKVIEKVVMYELQVKKLSEGKFVYFFWHIPECAKFNPKIHVLRRSCETQLSMSSVSTNTRTNHPFRHV